MTDKQKEKLILGCGYRSEKDAINLDMVQLPGVDVQHNLEIAPYPFEDNTFSIVNAIDVLEHLDNIVLAMNEIWRIMKPGGRLFIRGPSASAPEQGWRDPTHRRLFAEGTFDNWDPDTKDGRQYGFYFAPAKFKVLSQSERNLGWEYILEKIA